MAPFLSEDIDSSNKFTHGSPEDKSMPIAIVGMSFRGPGSASSVENLWKMICEKREARTAIPKSRWNNDAFYHPDFERHGTHNVEYGHFFEEDISKFDAPFFNMTSTEAAALDPAQRLLLECTYEALENGGIPLEKVVGTKTSVFVGSFATDYTDLLTRDPETVPMYQCTNSGQSRAMVANRLSYFFDLHGPSVTVDTACSGSLVALHLACQSLRTGEAKSAIAAGVNVVLNHEFMITMSMMKFLSPDGRCYTFDERGNGYARGEGVGAVFLKPLADALKDGDTIRAVIRGSGSNQDGKTSGITLPNPVAQEALIRDVYVSAGLNPLETSFVEAHGTGTSAGDPLETRALTKLFCGPNRPAEEPLMIGSIKSNVGHMEGASGIGAVVKAVLMLEQEVILPNRNFDKPNPRIPLDEWKLKVATEVEPWKAPGPVRVSINSFGYGGSNAHVILESPRTYLSSHALAGSFRMSGLLRRYLANPASDIVVHGSTNGHTNGNLTNGISIHSDRRPRLFIISAFDEPGGQRQVKTLASHIRKRAEWDSGNFLDDLAFTLNERRTDLIWKAAITAASTDKLVDALSKPIKFSRSFKNPVLGFVFTGQGAQWCGMGKELLATYPVFKSAIKRIGKYLHSIGAPFDVEDEITKDPKLSQINAALYSQPMCSAIQIALIELLASWGIKPTSVTGHSSGEIASAYAMGALSLEDAMAVAYYRGVCSTKMQEKNEINGAMMATSMSEEDATPLLANLRAGRAVVACVNSPSNVTISGDVSAIDELKKALESKGIFARKLAVEVAYHSHHMKLVAEDYSASISGIKTRQGNGIKFYSSVFGREAAADELGPSYWVANLLGQVKFAESLRQLCLTTGGVKKRRQAKGDVNVLIEIGPHSALAGPIKQILQADPKLKDTDIAYSSALVRKADAIKTTLDLAGKLVTAGHRLNFSAVNRPVAQKDVGVLVDLPPYTWNHSTSYWAEPRRSKVFRNRRFPRVDILGVRDESSDPLQLSWHNYLRVSEIPWLKQHKIQSTVVFPGAGYIAMAIEAAAQRAKENSVQHIGGYALREVTIETALLVPEQGAVETVVTLKPVSESARRYSDLWNEFHIFSVTDDNSWTEHCRGLISVQTKIQKDEEEDEDLAKIMSEIQEECKKNLPMDKFYDHLRGIGLDYGEIFANITEARATFNKSAGVLQLPETAETMPMGREHRYVIHPATLDAVLHAVFGALSADSWLKNPAIPVFIHNLFVSQNMPSQAGQRLGVQAVVSERDSQAMKTDITVTDPSSRTPVVHFSDLNWRFLAREIIEESTPDNNRVAYTIRWEPDVDLLGPEYAGKIYQSAADYIRLLGHKNPNLSVFDATELQDITLSILEALKGGDSSIVPRFETYTLTNAPKSSSSVTNDAFNAWHELISLKEFDLEADPASQGFQLNAYDVMVIAIHHAASSSLRKVLANARKLLKSDGRLIVLNEEKKDQGPVPSGCDSWLREAGFAGLDANVLECLTEEDYERSLLVARVSQEKRFDGSDILLIASDNSRGVDVDLLADMLVHGGGNATRGSLYDVDPAEKICVVLDISGKMLSNPSAEQFEAAKRIFTQSNNVLWVTSGGPQPSSNPEANVVTGLARTARTENGAARIVTLDLDREDRLSSKEAAQTIFKLFKACFGENETQKFTDSEYAERKGIVTIPRLIEDKVLNKTLESYVNPAAVEVQLFQQTHFPLRLQNSAGSADNFYFEEDLGCGGELGGNEIEIEVKAISLVSGSKVEMAAQDISGVVRKVGDDVEGLLPGDRVFGAGSEQISTVYQGRAGAFQKIPDDMAFETAVSLPTAYSTAYYAANHLGRVSDEDTVLIQSAATPLGQALIAVCERIGAKVYAGASTDEQRVFLESTLHVRKDYIIYNGDNSFVKSILKKTNGHGVDVIFNTLKGEGLRLGWNCTAPYGRFIELDTQESTGNTRLEMASFNKNTSFVALNFPRLKNDKPSVVDKVWAEMAGLIHEKEFNTKSPKTRLFNVERLGDALQSLKRGEGVGKVVVVFNPSDRVNVIPTNTSKALFCADASYLLIGGLGGIGRATALWMVDRGARNLIFANRSGMSKQEAKDTVAAIEQRGARAHVQKCDVSESAHVRQLVEECSTHMPPIRGVIQGAMVLRDMLLEKMTVDDYNAVVQSKVQGTWNLHNHLPKDMDFFVMLSSVSGIIGNTTQAAYAAGNTFMDAFAAFRNAQGLPAVTLDLGAISGVGYLAADENKDLLESMKRQGFNSTNEKLLMALIQSAIVNPHRQGESSQTVTGLGTWKRGQSLPAFDAPMFAHFRRLSPDPNGNGSVSKESEGVESVKAALRSCLALDEAAGVICTALIGYLAARSGIPAENFSSERTITEYGVDSIVAVELRNWIAHEMDSTVPILELLANNSLLQLSGKIASRSKSVKVEAEES